MEKHFMTLDLLGFKEMVTNLDEEKLKERIEKWISIVNQVKEKYSQYNYQLISDTLFVGGNTSNIEELFDFVNIGRTLLEEGLKNSFLIRGAITLDTYTWSELVYGKAVIKGHLLEGNQNWIGVCIDIKCIYGKREDFHPYQIIRYPVPSKKGRYETMDAINWNIPDYETLLNLASLGGYFKIGDFMPVSIQEKLDKTYIFKMYKEVLENNGDDDKIFYHNSPLEYIYEH